MTVRRKNRHLRILQKDSPLIIGGSVQLNRVHFSVQLWTNECLVDISGQPSKSAIYEVGVKLLHELCNPAGTLKW